MAATRYPWGSREYCRIPLTTAPRDVTTLPVEISIVPHPRHAAEDDWRPAVWLPDTDTPTAGVLIGPGTDFDLDVGVYVARLRITAGDERPVVEAAALVEIR